ncbi:hypothetical protein Rhopal_004773-T1 [Rhodotorula paludigena]|uniref:Pseudouridine synthase RsuA/RluA-like domain-containing protein n=1 Tax=Rhodotorula paludigena TaxID=86838 RepID=A0AAV5GPD0_9BASI|nr:hypothetical protein Rhopal_004773-T1 [Rhodotorula paludigena]
MAAARTLARTAPPRTPRPRPPAPPRVLPRIVFEDANHLVLDKPSGAALQGQHGSPARHLWDHTLATLEARPESPTLFPVHRLDKAVSGCLVLAKSAPTAKRLAQQFQHNLVRKDYLAVVHGQLRPGFEGLVDQPLAVGDNRVRVDDTEGVAARTRWECLSSAPHFSLLRLEPETGRKHQLRVHCADVLKAPIVGDFKLAPSAPHAQALADVGVPLDHVLLHSSSLSFYSWAKETGKRHTITARAHKLALP